MQEERRVIGVRNNNGRAEVFADIGVHRSRKKTRGCLPPPFMAGAGFRGQ